MMASGTPLGERIALPSGGDLGYLGGREELIFGDRFFRGSRRCFKSGMTSAI
jgi:hypothetical protein